MKRSGESLVDLIPIAVGIAVGFIVVATCALVVALIGQVLL